MSGQNRASAEAPGASVSSVLYLNGLGPETAREPEFFADLLLGPVVEKIVKDYDDSLRRHFYAPLSSVDEVEYRHEVWRDLDDPALASACTCFIHDQRNVRQRLTWAQKTSNTHFRRALRLDAISIYCRSVTSLLDALSSSALNSRALRGVRERFGGHVGSPGFIELRDGASHVADLLNGVRYNVNIKAQHVRVSRYAGEADYGAEIEDVFKRFQQSAATDYRAKISDWPDLNHIEGLIVDRVALLFRETFGRLADFVDAHPDFITESVSLFEREIQFYVSYLAFTTPMMTRGLAFCLPEVSADRQYLNIEDTFDIALASSGADIVTNDVVLEPGERVIVVSGPNQGGKTTFARAIAQVHWLARLGCPVPGRSASVALYDHLFTHFAREEDYNFQNGKLEEDVLRMREILRRVTPRSIVIMNEIFSSTSTQDALALATQVLSRLVERDVLSVVVTFLDELTRLDASVVSMTSDVDQSDPSVRTFKITRRPGDGLAYAYAIAEKYRLDYPSLRQDLSS